MVRTTIAKALTAKEELAKLGEQPAPDFKTALAVAKALRELNSVADIAGKAKSEIAKSCGGTLNYDKMVYEFEDDSARIDCMIKIEDKFAEEVELDVAKLDLSKYSLSANAVLALMDFLLIGDGSSDN